MHIKLIAATMIAALLWAGGTMVAPAITEPKVAEPTVTQASLPQPAHTVQEAEAAALAHAGFTAEQVTRLHTEVDYENGRKEFEVEFRSGDWEYDYTVAAADGRILKSDKEYDPPKQVKTPAETKPAETKPAETKKISASDAKAIALKHAGLTADQVKGLRAEYDRDDGRPEYEVEFRVGNWEYDYEIHAETGKILSWDKELDD